MQCLTHSLYKLTQPDELTVLCYSGYGAVKRNILQCNDEKYNAVSSKGQCNKEKYSAV